MWTLFAVTVMFFIRKAVWVMELRPELKAVLCFALVCLVYEVHDLMEYRYQEDG